MSLQVELLEESFNYIKPYGDLFVSSFYENLFKNNSNIQSLFIKIDPEIQKNKFWKSLVLVIENLRQPEVLKNILQGFGAKLFTDGVLLKHYPQIRDAFLATFKQFLGNKWNADLEQAWEDAYVEFRESMLEGAEQANEQITRKIAMKKLRSESTATAIPKKAQSVIEEKNEVKSVVEAVTKEEGDQIENKSSKSNKLLFMGGGLAGVIGVLVLIILL
ncbi:MAG: globin domain-containing protein [Cyanobacteria bacterium P01_F01_bin.143]